MQCQSYFPVYHSNYDLNLDANGGARPIHNGNGTFQNGYLSKYVPSSSVPQGSLEVLRQTILMHDATFRDQVLQLHRLYRRQKELMGEFRSQELYTSHSHLQDQSSNPFSNYSSSSVQNTQHSLPLANMHWKPSTAGIDHIQTPPGSANPIVSQNGGHLNSLHFPESKCRKIGRKFLDLELPAEVYIDSEEEETLEDAKFPNPPMPTSLSSSLPSEVMVGTDLMASINLQGAFSGLNSFAHSYGNLADLNTPKTASCSGKNDGIFGNEATYYGLEMSEGNHDTSNGEKARSDGASATLKFVDHQVDNANSELCSGSSQRNSSVSLGKNPCVVQALPCFTNQVHSSKGAKIMSRMKGHIVDKLDVNSKGMKNSYFESILKDSVVSLSSVTSDHSVHVNCLNYIDLNSEFTPTSDTAKAFAGFDGERKNTMLSKPGFSEVSFSREDDTRVKQISSVNSRGGETTRKIKKCRLIDINLPCDPGAEEEPAIEDDQLGGDCKYSAGMNLNLCMKDDAVPPKYTCPHRIPSEIDLEAPPSPEVEECPPPRGDSEENHPETHQVSTPEDGGDPFLELAKVAAEAIISISSSSKSEPCHESGNLQKCETSGSGTLEWFAGLIQSMSQDLENDFGTLDEFEAMTLKLTEMKEEEYLCKTSAQIEIFSSSVPLAAQMRKGRTRRSKRKDFQREVLPSLASLSRYEVTEDIQIIEGLMEAAGTPWHQTRARRACRMGRKPQAAKQPMCSTSDIPDLKCGAPMSWGKAKTQPRGRRSPASPSTVLTRWLVFLA